MIALDFDPGETGLPCAECGGVCCALGGPIPLLPGELDRTPELALTQDAGPCPLLVDGRCLAGDDRPVVCRAYPVRGDGTLYDTCPHREDVTAAFIARVVALGVVP